MYWEEYDKKTLNLLKEAFDKIDNNGQGLKAMASKLQIKKITEEYKNIRKNNTVKNFDEFFSYFSNESLSLINKCETAKYVIKKQFEEKHALQPGILTECFTAKAIANVFDCDECVNAKSDEDIVINGTVTGTLGRIGNITAPRYYYINSKTKEPTIVAQCGDNKSTDILLIRNKAVVHLECKESDAKLEELDIFYNDDWKLYAPESWNGSRPIYEKLIDEFNENNDARDFLGKNYNLMKESKLFTDDNIREIVNEYAGDKKIDLILFACEDVIYPVLPSNLVDVADFKTSEIRIAGRNGKKPFLTDVLDDALKLSNAEIYYDGKKKIVKMSVDYLKETYARGSKNVVGRYKIKVMPTFYVLAKYVSFDGKYAIFEYARIKQNKSSISPHIKYVVKSLEQRENDSKLGHAQVIKLINDYANKK